MQAEINLSEAALFARTFYAALANRVSIDQAMAEARARLIERNLMAERPGNPLLESVKGSASLPAWTVPTLFMHEEADGWLKQGALPEAIRCLRDGKVMLLIESPGGNFYVDKYPVTSAQYQAYLQATGRHNWDNVWQGVAGEETDQIPATNVSRQEAEKYAHDLGKDLPTLAQWRWAATGGKGITRYPWGDKFEEQRCNSLEYWSGPPKPTPVTQFGPQNAAGVCDIVGNMAEIAGAGDEWVYVGGRHRDPKEIVIVDRPFPPSFSGPLRDVGFRTVATVTRYGRLLTDGQIEQVSRDARDALL
jgi:hypothetical protein